VRKRPTPWQIPSLNRSLTDLNNPPYSVHRVLHSVFTARLLLNIRSAAKRRHVSVTTNSRCAMPFSLPQSSTTRTGDLNDAHSRSVMVFAPAAAAGGEGGDLGMGMGVREHETGMGE